VVLFIFNYQRGAKMFVDPATEPGFPGSAVVVIDVTETAP
jgi:SET family sugar efflux transporter-like MFS transporter